MRTIIVIGHARSGTSLPEGILHHLGVNMGNKKNWRRADEANEKGYFENRYFVDVNIDITENNTVDRGRMRKLVEKYKDEVWGVKDPRFLQTWEYWKPYFENPIFILVKRDPKSISRSVGYRDDGKYTKEKRYEDTMKEVKQYYKDAEQLDEDVLVVNFEDYFKNDDQIMQIAEYLDLPYKKTDLVDPNLKHF